MVFWGPFRLLLLGFCVCSLKGPGFTEIRTEDCPLDVNAALIRTFEYCRRAYCILLSRYLTPGCSEKGTLLSKAQGMICFQPGEVQGHRITSQGAKSPETTIWIMTLVLVLPLTRLTGLGKTPKLSVLHFSHARQQQWARFPVCVIAIQSNDSIILMLCFAIKTLPKRSWLMSKCKIRAVWYVLHQREQKGNMETQSPYVPWWVNGAAKLPCLYLPRNKYSLAKKLTDRKQFFKIVHMRSMLFIPEDMERCHYWTVMEELLPVWNPSGDHILMQCAYRLSLNLA